MYSSNAMSIRLTCQKKLNRTEYSESIEKVTKMIEGGCELFSKGTNEVERMISLRLSDVINFLHRKATEL